MVEYSFEEAVDLLTKNLESAEKNLKGLDEDIGFLKEQITTTEVSILPFILFYFLFIVSFPSLEQTSLVFTITTSSREGRREILLRNKHFTFDYWIQMG